MRSPRCPTRPTSGACCRKRPASGCRASTSAAATRASSPATRASASRISRGSSPTASTIRKASAAPGSTRTTSPNEEVSVSALGSDVEMNSPRRRGRVHDQERRQQVQRPRATSPTSRVAGSATTTPTRSSCARASPAHPNLLFWEGHADLGGPIKTDKVWFFAAFNHFKIDKQVSGVPQTIATDLGMFDNYTAKGPGKPSPNDTVIGYFQRGPQAEAAPRPVGAGAAGVGSARRTAGRGCTRANGSAVLEQPAVPRRQRRTPFGLADGPAGRRRPAANSPRTNRPPAPLRPARAGTRSPRSGRKPQVKAQADLLHAEQGRQPRLQVRLRGHATTTITSGSTASPDRIACRIRPAARRRIRFGSSTSARRATTTARGRAAPTSTSITRVLRAGSLGAEQSAVHHRRPPLRLPGRRY